MEWRDEGLLLAVRKHGETSVIADVFTQDHGRHAGIVRGGTSRKMSPILQPGAQIDVVWKARLEDHLGSFSVEPIRSRMAGVIDTPLALAGMNAALALLGFALPERSQHAELFETSVTLCDLICATDAWPLAYLRWEIQLLEEIGFGLDLYQCAVTGDTQDLQFISPKTGRAVAARAAGEWSDRLLPFPPCMVGAGDADDADIARGLQTTGHFL
ncbi:MAG: DNA repair protein RecO, partial [Pseudomonadota bacterium]